MQKLCVANGGGAVPAADAPMDLRALVEVALENVKEGCVGETWGALIAMHQSMWAEDLAVRSAFREIARDEVRHAALAWAVHRWVLGELDEGSHREIQRAEERAWDELQSALAAVSEHGTSQALGLPDVSVSLQLARSLRAARQMWRCPSGAREGAAHRDRSGVGRHIG
ncbi:MAG: hypothetical protein U0325_29010 [Polyangiales bacterium]